MKIGDRVVWLNRIVTPELKGGIWTIQELKDDVATIHRIDKAAPDQKVSTKNLLKAL